MKNYLYTKNQPETIVVRPTSTYLKPVGDGSFEPAIKKPSIRVKFDGGKFIVNDKTAEGLGCKDAAELNELIQATSQFKDDVIILSATTEDSNELSELAQKAAKGKEVKRPELEKGARTTR